jgi:hypothetical protein
VPAAAVVDALVRPDLELLAQLRPDRVRVARLLGQPAVPGSAVAALLERQFEAMAAGAVPLLDPAVPADELRQRLRWVRAAASAVLAGATEQDTVDGRLEWLVGFAAAGLSAPPTPIQASSGKVPKAKKRKKA